MKEFSVITHALCGETVSTKNARVIRLNRQRQKDPKEVDRRPRLLLVKFEKEEDAEALFTKRFGLSEAGFPNVYITKDLSKEERERQWRL